MNQQVAFINVDGKEVFSIEILDGRMQDRLESISGWTTA